ncbi:MAG: CHASE2 domain-containing protein [Hyphomicrobium sp.]
MTTEPATTAMPRSLFPWFRLTVGAACLAGLIGLLFVPQFLPWVLRFEHATADWRTALLSDRLTTPHPEIAVVTITPATLRDYANSPIDRGLLARTVSAIDAAGAAVIGLDIYFLKATEPQKDKALIDALKSAKAKVVLGAWDERGQMEPFQREFQKSFSERIGHPAGYLNLRHQRDDVVRYRASPHPGSAYPESLSRLLARASGHDGADSERPIAWLLPPANGVQTFETLPAHTFVAGEHGLSPEKAAAAAKALAGKIVLVGGDFPERDRHRTPLSAWTSESMSGVFIHANMIADLLDPRRSIAELPPSVARNLVGLVALVSCVIGWLLWQSSIVQYLGYTFATLVLVAVDAFVYREFRLLLPITLILAAWFLGVTGGRAIRFFIHWFLGRSRIST